MRRINHVESYPTEKYHDTYPPNRRDYISNLPDGVLSNILSRLSIKDAVQTCVLSKYWEFKWTTSIYNVDIDIEDFSIESRKEWAFVNIVERVLHHLQSVRNVSLTCSSSSIYYELSRITVLVSGILRRNVKRLELDIRNTQDFFLPRSLLYCTSLTKLHLSFETRCSFRVPSKNCFPNLKYLTLKGVKILNEISNTDTLIFTFPVLKMLELIDCKWVKVKFVEIYAPSLDTFASLPLTEWNDKKDLDYTIKILGTMLDGLNINCQENIIMNGSNVVHANLECISDHPVLSLEECGLRVRKLLRELSNLTYLSFADLQAIGQTKLGLPLPKFHQLKSMHLTLDTPFDAEGLLELLHAAPVLESLVIVLNNREDYDYDSVEPVPSCVVNHLEELTFCYYECLKPKFLVEKFLLKNGAQLKTVFVSNDKESRKLTDNEMVEKLSTFPKASASLHFRLW